MINSSFCQKCGSKGIQKSFMGRNDTTWEKLAYFWLIVFSLFTILRAYANSGYFFRLGDYPEYIAPSWKFIVEFSSYIASIILSIILILFLYQKKISPSIAIRFSIAPIWILSLILVLTGNASIFYKLVFGLLSITVISLILNYLGNKK